MPYANIFAASLADGNGGRAAETLAGSGSSFMENISNTLVSGNPSASMGVTHYEKASTSANPFLCAKNVSFISSVFDISVCPQWCPVNHMYFQLANTFFFLSYLAPSGLYGLVYLRCTHLIGCALFALWGWSVICSFDAFLWNANFVVINFIHVCVLLYRLRPIKFSKEVEEVYAALFQPLKVSRHQFKKVLDCMKMIRPLKYQEVYAQEKVTKVDSLSLVLSGKLVVSQNFRALHIVFPHQFLDSPEWFGVSTDEFFQVSVTAMEESRVLLWHRDKLKLTIITDSFLQAVFDHILGRDVVKKLMQIPVVDTSDEDSAVLLVNETMAASVNGHLPNSLEDAGESEEKPMLIVKKSGDGPGITALINRQLQDEGFVCEHDPLLSSADPLRCTQLLALRSQRDAVAAAVAKANAAESSEGTKQELADQNQNDLP
ncbi:blood vessel epicardial substance isoform X1 [Frankliniella occidentalis]|uniref:Blood vessel epicardial substance isoform X1 n=1 Tax=Frankliniella occidentalis TaxID=133901 RepID=A0A6J1TBL3_FRAOC|nr:blood vessel epicardial substance isoform X1 [Frankliniella occidentalis]